jgi:hypothetical protein
MVNYILLMLNSDDTICLSHYQDPKVIVTAYLSNNRVVSKNKDAEQFTNALSVFVDRQQSKVVDDGTPSSSQVRYESLRARFKDVCAKHKESKKSQAQKTHSR